MIYISAFLLGSKKGTLSYIIYLLLGLVGLPVFSGFTGGVGKLAGPTGGYLIGFILLAYIVGFCVEKFEGTLYVRCSLKEKYINNRANEKAIKDLIFPSVGKRCFIAFYFLEKSTFFR